MKERPVITKDCVRPMLDAKFIKVFDLQYAPGRHYYDATRHAEEDLTVLKSDREFRNMLPDAVTIYTVINTPGNEPRLLLSYEYRYPVGQYLLSPPAGLLDREDRKKDEPLFAAAAREIKEETGIEFTEHDRMFLVNPLVFSTPGMTDESNALVAAVIERPDLSSLNRMGAEETENFGDFVLVTQEEAAELLEQGRDPEGKYYPAYTWMALAWFVLGRWKKDKE